MPVTFCLAILLQTALIETILNPSTEKDAREAAIQKLEAADLIEVVTRADSNSEAHKSAARRLTALVPALSDAEVLGRIALLRATLATYFPRRKAIAKVTDQAILARVAMSEEEGEIREQVLERISDPAMLEQVARSGLYADARVTALKRLPALDARLANAILIFAVEKGAWSQLGTLGDLRFTRSPEAKKSLEALSQRGSGYGPNAARALLTGLKTSAWPQLATDSYLQVRPEKDAYFFGGRVPPGKYALKVGYEEYRAFTSTRDETVTGDLRSGTCYRIASGKTFPDAMGKSTWSPKIVEERCLKTK